MTYTCDIKINKPIDEVISLFDNPDNMKEWQPGLISFEPISGDPGQPGAKSRLQYKMGKRDIEMIETVLVRNLPEEFSGTYAAEGVFNKVNNKFVALDENTTHWITDQEFQFKGMMKLMAWVMPGAFKKQSMKYLVYFKEFAENQ